ncbi:MAG TPA: hypothetical protein VHQ95_01115, partial [Pyrinomonadaceae bacterium]|nr:hypothetical protein [Pyrinomonadaceae bacterium]
EFAHSDFLIRSGDNDTQFYVVETRGFWQQMLNDAPLSGIVRWQTVISHRISATLAAAQII